MQRRDAPAGGRRPGRADRDPDDPRLPPGARRHRARRGARPGLLARHEPGDRVDGRLPDDHDPVGRRRRRRPRRVPAALGPADGRGDDHEPLDARACSRRGSASCSTRSTRRARWPTWTARTSTRSSAGSSRARPASTSCTSTSTRRSRRRTAAAARAPGPVGVGETLLPFLPSPRVLREDDGTFRLERPGERPTSIGRLRAFVGNTGVLVRAYAYIRAHGGSGPARGQRRRGPRGELPAEARRRGLRHPVSTGPASTSSSRRRRPIKKRTGVRTLDIAKRLIDYGFHPPTIYFPLIVEEGDADRADRDRVGRDARRVRRRADRDRRARPTTTPSSSRPRRTPRRSAGSTRRRPPASRTCAGGR